MKIAPVLPVVVIPYTMSFLRVVALASINYFPDYDYNIFFLYYYSFLL